MRVRYLGPDKTPPSQRPFLTYGAIYVVLAIEILKGNVDFRIMGDDGTGPVLHRSTLFDLVSDEVPSNWRIRLGAGGSPGAVDIAPEPWLDDGFWEDYFSDGGVAAVAAQEIFRREAEKIISESE